MHPEALRRPLANKAKRGKAVLTGRSVKHPSDTITGTSTVEVTVEQSQEHTKPKAMFK